MINVHVVRMSSTRVDKMININVVKMISTHIDKIISFRVGKTISTLVDKIISITIGEGIPLHDFRRGMKEEMTIGNVKLNIRKIYVIGWIPIRNMTMR